MSLALCMRRGIRLAAFVCAITALRAELIYQPNFLPGSGIEVQVNGFYDKVPPSGFFPVRVKIRNGTEANRSWQLVTDDHKRMGGTVRANFSLPVEALSERTFDLLIPLASQPETTSRYTNLAFELSGYAVQDGRRNLSMGTGGRVITPYLGMGDALAVKNWEPLKEMLEKQGYGNTSAAKPDPVSLDGTSLDVTMLPQDWRGLEGFGVIVFTDDEWRKIPAAEKTALQDWIAQGGRLILCHEGMTGDLPPQGVLGTGSIEQWQMGNDFLTRMSAMLQGLPRLPASDTGDSYDPNWKLARDVGAPNAPQALILTFVVIFAAVVGPINFLVFAPGGRRHRLFWTTPLISIGASVLMALFIVLSEGFGGRGQRFEVTLNLPELHKSVSWQEQVSRTGVLGGSSFALSEPTIIQPIGIGDRDDRGSSATDRSSYRLDGAIWSGDWFRSRSTQAQVLTTIAPTRSRLEISNQPDGTPVAISSFESDLEELWYLDASGKTWKAGRLKPGEKRTLEAVADERQFGRWLENNLVQAGKLAKNRAMAFRDNGLKGKFFASTKNPQFLPSLPSIRWEKGEGLIMGAPAR